VFLEIVDQYLINAGYITGDLGGINFFLFDDKLLRGMVTEHVGAKL